MKMKWASERQTYQTLNVPFMDDLVPAMIGCNIQKRLFTLLISWCVWEEERDALCMKTGPGLMLHEDHGEFILMGRQPLKPNSHDFFISRREQEVSQLTGANATNCAVGKRWDMENKEEEERVTAGFSSLSTSSEWNVYALRCVCAVHPAPCSLL